MKLRIWGVNHWSDSLKPLIAKWHLKRTPMREGFDGERVYSKDTENPFEYWIELNTLEDLFELQKDLYEETEFNNELIISKWVIGKYEDNKYKEIEEGFGLKIYNDYME